MAGPKKERDGSRDDPTKLPFEEALEKLHTIVERMESEDLPLEALIEQYELGIKLVQICQHKLAEAELKIKKLEKDAKGQLQLKPENSADAQRPTDT